MRKLVFDELLRENEIILHSFVNRMIWGNIFIEPYFIPFLLGTIMCDAMDQKRRSMKSSETKLRINYQNISTVIIFFFSHFFETPIFRI